MTIERTDFGRAGDKPVSLYTLTNANGASVQMTNYGAIVVSINVPDRSGTNANVNCGFDSLEPYLAGHPFFGATVGRFANRIAGGAFSIDGQNYKLATNNGPNHLHGGQRGFDKKVWEVTEIDDGQDRGLKFSLFSPDGDEGYPGNLHVDAIYLWDDEDRLTIRFRATTDQATHLNLTNHAYFNLAGVGSGKVYDHRLRLFADQMLDVDATLIPTGRFLDVAGTPWDFTQPRRIGESIAKLTDTKGYDHCYVVKGAIGTLRPCGVVVDPDSGRSLEVQTTQPGVQLYTGNHLPGTAASGGVGQHEAFCLETQHFPDSPNKPDFPTTLLLPGEQFDETTTWRFFVSEDA